MGKLKGRDKSMYVHQTGDGVDLEELRSEVLVDLDGKQKSALFRYLSDHMDQHLVDDGRYKELKEKEKRLEEKEEELKNKEFRLEEAKNELDKAREEVDSELERLKNREEDVKELEKELEKELDKLDEEDEE